MATITYHQVGACNGFIVSPGPPTQSEHAGTNRAFVIFAIENIANSQTGTPFFFDPNNLFVSDVVHLGLNDFLLPMTDPIYTVILKPPRAVQPTTVPLGQVMNFSPTALAAIIVSTHNSDGATEANMTPYPLLYKTGSTDKQITMMNSNPSQTSFPGNADCSLIQLQ